MIICIYGCCVHTAVPSSDEGARRRSHCAVLPSRRVFFRRAVEPHQPTRITTTNRMTRPILIAVELVVAVVVAPRMASGGAHLRYPRNITRSTAPRVHLRQGCWGLIGLASRFRPGRNAHPAAHCQSTRHSRDCRNWRCHCPTPERRGRGGGSLVRRCHRCSAYSH